MSLIIFTGRQCKLKVHQEERLAKYLKYKAAIGSGISRDGVRFVIKEVLDEAEKKRRLVNEC